MEQNGQPNQHPETTLPIDVECALFRALTHYWSIEQSEAWNLVRAKQGRRPSSHRHTVELLGAATLVMVQRYRRQWPGDFAFFARRVASRYSLRRLSTV